MINIKNEIRYGHKVFVARWQRRQPPTPVPYVPDDMEYLEEMAREYMNTPSEPRQTDCPLPTGH